MCIVRYASYLESHRLFELVPLLVHSIDRCSLGLRAVFRLLIVFLMLGVGLNTNTTEEINEIIKYGSKETVHVVSRHRFVADRGGPSVCRDQNRMCRCSSDRPVTSFGGHHYHSLPNGLTAPLLC